MVTTQAATTQLVKITEHPYRNLPEELRIGDRLFRSLSLNFVIQRQTQSNWCWAATATSVSHFYLFTSIWTQCSLANAELGHSDCCNSPVPGACNVPWYLEKALTRTDNFVSLTGTVGFDTVRAEIDAGRVVGARVAWSGGGAHFVAISGYITSDGTEYFDISDPGSGSTQQYEVGQFSTSYLNTGTWTHTYFTKQAPKMIKTKPISLDEGIIRCIWEASPLLQLKYDNLREIKSPRDLSLAIPHYIYTMGLDALTQEHGLPQKPSVLRVLEMQGEKSLAFFDVDTTGPSPRICQIGTTPYLELFNRALTAAMQMITQSEAETELRLLQVPALHFEALWLHYDDPAKDVFIPLREQGALTAFQVYGVNDFLAELTKIAKAQPPVDDLMGG